VETALAEIWAQILGIERVGRHDHFFELGGHSLLAVRVLERMRRELSIRVPLSVLFGNPTLAKFVPAAASLGVRVSDQSLLRHGESSQAVLLKEGKLPALFLLPAVGGGLSYYSEFVHEFGADCAVYGLHAYLERFNEAMTIGDMARVYKAVIRQVQPQGPYRLLGYSFGGIVATELAAQLEDDGDVVELLTLIDVKPSSSRGSSSFGEAEQWSAFCAFIMYGGGKIDPPAYSEDFDRNIEALSDLLKRVDIEHVGSLRPRDLLTIYDTYQRSLKAMASHEVRQTSVPALQFVATQTLVEGDLENGRRAWTNCEFVEVDANHENIMVSKAVRKVASTLTRKLSKMS